MSAGAGAHGGWLRRVKLTEVAGRGRTLRDSVLKRSHVAATKCDLYDIAILFTQMAQIARIRPSQATRKCPYPFWCEILAGVMATLPSFLPESRSQPFIFKLVHALTPSCVLGSPRDRHQSTRLALYFRFRPSPPRPPSPPSSNIYLE